MKNGAISQWRANRHRFLIPAIVAMPITTWGCEPILPLYQLLTGSSLAGAAIITHSLLWLAAAVVIKCGAFVFLERRLSWGRSILFMLLANVISTIPGVMVAALTASLGGFLFALVLVCGLGWFVQCRIALLPKARQFPSLPAMVTVGFVVFFFVSAALFEFAGSALAAKSFAGYWILKFIFVTLVACTGIFISAVLEESVIARLSRKGNEVFYYKSVFRANYITLAVVLSVVALEMLPKRLAAPHFLVSWIQSLSTALGLT
jgi:hypothetical protein